MKRNEKIVVYLSREHKEKFESRASARDLSLSSWAIQAMLSYERSSKRGAKTAGEREIEKWKSDWPKAAKCWHCKRLGHDPLVMHAVHYPDGVPSGAWDELPKLMTTEPEAAA